MTAASRFLSWWMRSPGRVQVAGRLVGAVQRGGMRVRAVQAAVLHRVAIPVRADFQLLSKRFAGIRRRLRDLEERLDEADWTK